MKLSTVTGPKEVENLLLTAEAVRNCDRIAIEEYGIPGPVLMENAGKNSAEILLSLLEKGKDAGPVYIFAGAGNNGGDGYVIARHLINQGVDVKVFLCSPEEKIRGDALINLKILKKMGAPLLSALSESELAPYLPEMGRGAAIVDALLGTGLKREVSGWFAKLIEILNEIQGPLKVAVDIPSGLNADTGRPQPLAFVADVTFTFAAKKLGLLLPPAQPYVGQLYLVQIGMPPEIILNSEIAARINSFSELKSLWKSRPFNSHKGTFGHLLILGGQRGKAGAPVLSGLAAMRTGAGLVTLAVEEIVSERIEGKFPDLMCESIPNIDDRAAGSSGWQELNRLEDFPSSVIERVDRVWGVLSLLLEGKNSLLVGPGFGQSAVRKALLLKILREYPHPVTIDADGLNLLQKSLTALSERTAPTVLTPHPGEMARLLGSTSSEVQADRLRWAGELAEKTGAVVVLKGARTVIASPDGEVWLNLTGNPSLATAGTGDVLAGMVASLLARGLRPVEAARLAVFAHGEAADRLLDTQSQHSLMPTDLIQYLPKLFRKWEEMN